MGHPEDLLQKTALDQARLIASRELSSSELVELYLERIARLNPRFQAFVDVFADRARRDARAKDALLRGTGPVGPFHGVPIGIKDLNLVKGSRTRFGSLGHFPVRSPVDDATVARLRRAGFIIMGKLATSELGALPVTEPSLHPPTRNPWSADHTSGGSSGGSATAVSGGLLPIAQGSDGGGSIRIPASFTGLVGLKPARGRLPNQFGLPDRMILYTTGALTRTVAEAAAMLDLMSGLSTGEPHWAAPPPKSYSELYSEAPARLRIAVTVDSTITQVHPEVRAAVLELARSLERLGHRVEERQPAEIRVADFLPLWQFLMAGMPLLSWKRTQPITRWLRETGRRLKRREVEALHHQLEARLLDWFGDIDLWLTPTVAHLPPRVGEYAQDDRDPEAAFHRVAELGAFTAFANATGQPAISVPAGVSSSGLPIGAQLIARPQNEALLLQLARVLELERPWTHRFL